MTNPLIDLLSISAAGQAAYISEVLRGAEGYEHHTADERRAMLLGYILGLSVALKGEAPFAKGELAARIEQIDELMGNREQ